MPHTIHRQGPAMATLFEVILAGEDAEHLEAVACACFDEIERVERLLSRFDPAGEIARINRNARTIRLTRGSRGLSSGSPLSVCASHGIVRSAFKIRCSSPPHRRRFFS